MSLDKVESSNPNLKAVHAGASTRKTRHLQPNASNAADAEGGLFCLFHLDSLPTFRYLGAFGLNRHWDGYFAHAALYVPSRC